MPQYDTWSLFPSSFLPSYVIFLIPLFYDSTDTICMEVHLCHFAPILGFLHWHFHTVSKHKFGNFRRVYFAVGKTLKITFLKVWKKVPLRWNITDFIEDHTRHTPNTLCDKVIFFQNVLKIAIFLDGFWECQPNKVFFHWHSHILIYYGCDRG
jgi:hypothetical protein